MLNLVFKNFIRTKGTKFGLLFLFLTGIFSLFVGKQFQDKQQKITTDAIACQKENLVKNATFHPDEMGLVLYYQKFSLLNETTPIAGLSMGQRDVNSSLQTLTIRGLEAQRYDSDIQNSQNLLIGNIDFSFVLLYLFPLFIIAFTYNIISASKENGSWKIIATQSSNTFLFILKLFYVRGLVFLGLSLILFFVAIFSLKIPINREIVLFFLIAVLYVLFWFAVCFFVVSLQKKSNFNAIVLLSVWLVLTLIIPASINGFIVNKFALPEALELTLNQRNGYHKKWDTDKKATVEKFYSHYPQFKKYPIQNDQFSWLWYYAMQQMGDDETAFLSQDIEKKLAERNQFTQSIVQFFPTIHTQLVWNDIAQSDLKNHLLFLKETKKFHEKLRLYFYPKIFENAPVKSEKWNEFKVQTFSDKSKIDAFKSVLPLVLINFVLFLLGYFNFKKTPQF